MAPPPPILLDAHAISGITGSISIACWIIVFTPQLYENFRRQSAEGLSLTFVLLWLAGDVFNVIGATLQGVLPTMIILAIYYTIADIVLLAQCLEYHRRSRNRAVDPTHLSPATPLLDSISECSEDSYSTEGNEASQDSESQLEAAPLPMWRVILFNTVLVLLVFASGFLGWALSSQKNSDGSQQPDDDDIKFDLLGQIFGWLCAVLYLGSRFPQILLNYERKSCEGISFLFFLFACLGNLTFVISILAWDLSPKYLLVNASWLAGSVGTLFLDMIIFIQFWTYNVGPDFDEI